MERRKEVCDNQSVITLECENIVQPVRIEWYKTNLEGNTLRLSRVLTSYQTRYN